MKLLQLLHCDIYRDGGSLEGVWRTDEDTEWAATLRIENRRTQDKPQTYHLYNARLNYTNGALPIRKNSPEHRAMQTLIDSWVQEQNVSLAELEKERANCNRLYDLLTELDKGNF